jgi:acetylornithine aminotransferase
MGEYLKTELAKIPQIDEIRGEGLMIGFGLSPEYATVPNKLLFESKIFTGNAKGNVMRLLPPLSVSKNEIDIFIHEFKKQII